MFSIINGICRHESVTYFKVRHKSVTQRTRRSVRLRYTSVHFAQDDVQGFEIKGVVLLINLLSFVLRTSR